MSRPCMLEGGKCSEEAAADSPFCHEHATSHCLTSCFSFCAQHEVVHLDHFRCPACVLQQEFGFRMDVLHNDYPMDQCGKYVKGKKIL